MAIDLKILIKNQVHFGHQTSRWSPKMEPYIWGYKNNIHLIDVSKTAHQLEKAGKFLESMASEGKAILWVGTKKAAQELMHQAALQLNSPYVVHRWVGGTFSNYRQVRKSIAKLLYYEDILAKSDQFPYNKKELNLFQKKIDRLERNVGGIRNLMWPIGAVVVVDVKKEHVCVKEALTMGIPVVALVDTNSDPSGISYVIPGNDDAPRAIKVIIDYLVECTQRGKAVAAAKPEAETALMEMFETEKPGVFDTEEEEESGKKRRSQGGARGGQRRAAGARPKAGARRPTSQSSEMGTKSRDVAPSDATIQTPAVETKTAPIESEPTIQNHPLEKKSEKVTATESTIQTPDIERKKSAK